MNEAHQQHQSSHYLNYLGAKWRSLNSTEKIIALRTSSYVAAAAAKASLIVGLRTIGFSAFGPVAHSWAAAWQSAVATTTSGHHESMSASVGAALFSWAQHVAMTWHIFSPSAAVVGIIAAVYFSSGYIVQSARSVVRAGIFGGEEESRSFLLPSGGGGGGSGGEEVEGPALMEIDAEKSVHNVQDAIADQDLIIFSSQFLVSF